MGVIVQKFGGTSLATPAKIMAAARRAIRAKLDGHGVVMVVSARGKRTDELLELAAEVAEKPTARELDMLLSTGEQESIALVAMAVEGLGHAGISFTGAQIRLETDRAHTKARIRSISAECITEALAGGQIVVVAGFQGVDPDGNITTLGRGASDTTAVALAAVLKADLCEIYTDVDGVFTTNPKVVAEARKLERISYDEMLELAGAGAGVMHSRSIEFAKKHGVAVHVRSAATDADGTLITGEDPQMQQLVVCGAAIHEGQARVTLVGVPDVPGIATRIFQELAHHQIVVDMIVQNVSSDGTTEVSFTVGGGELAEALALMNETTRAIGAAGMSHQTDQATVSVVGAGMRTHSGVAHRMFTALSEAGINVDMITTSDIKISVLVAGDDAHDALRAVHAAFALDKPGCELAARGDYEPRPAPIGINSLQRDLASIVAELPTMEDIVVSDIAADTGQGSVIITGVPDRPGIASTIFSEIGRGGVVVDMICQNVSSEGLTDVSFTVPIDDLGAALLLSREVCEQIGGTGVLADKAIAKVMVLGVGIRTNTDVAVKMFGALASRNINIKMIATSEVATSVIIDADQANHAVAVLTEAFGLEAGVG